jgi:hypothetical protein
MKFTRVLLLTFFACMFMHNSLCGQVKATGKGFYAPSWDLAKDRLYRMPIGGTTGFYVKLDEVITAQHAGALFPVAHIIAGSNFLKGSEFFINNLTDDTEYIFEICNDGGLVGSSEPICYKYRFYLPKGSRSHDLGSFVFLIDQKRWVPLNVILGN